VVSADGSCQLECLCGHVIDGRFDSKLPFFTPYGSFWTNNSPSLTSRIKDDFQVSILRGHCFSAGYQSMALIPIKQQGKRVGLIQINDFKAGAFTENLIEYLETIASQIGLAVRNSMIHTNLKEREQELEQAQQELLTSNRRPSLFHLQT
jgi:GAF domain-containing protein